MTSGLVMSFLWVFRGVSSSPVASHRLLFRVLVVLVEALILRPVTLHQRWFSQVRYLPLDAQVLLQMLCGMTFEGNG